ncbi:LolA family protein [Parapedobacter sp. 10938]|uniref:LolA family protein n=1 Tax=Parapedobacter flavus TaxID=3110225 RepID=UPI002DBA2B03|nr:outer membrane lipoprotein carrier protein LolA [Parapedobacter sp. 10938]MEC3881088.1 outer membrane lipoprotein carrier protein LolA [Parapedobacter sp. 10938]
MNNPIYKAIILAIVVSMALPGHAQTDAAAKKLLDKVSQTYDAYKTIQADFSLRVKQAQQVTHTESGTIAMDKSAGKYHITTGNEEIISDGKTQWMVLKDIGEVQVTEVSPASDAISPANIFSFYKAGYKYVSAANEQAGGKKLAVIELTPEEVNAAYFKIKLRVDERTYQIHDVTVFDKGGHQFVYTITHAKANPPFADKHFIFQKANYPDMEIVDLR